MAQALSFFLFWHLTVIQSSLSSCFFLRPSAFHEVLWVVIVFLDEIVLGPNQILEMLRQHSLALFDEMTQHAERAERAESGEREECLESLESPESPELQSSAVTLGSCPDARSFSTTISACAKGGDWKRALQLFSRMQQWSIIPDRHCHTALLSSFQRGKAWRLGLKHLLKPTAFGSALNELDAIGYDTSLSHCATGAWQEALVILGQMQKQNLEPSIAGLFSLVKTIQNAGQQNQQNQQDQDTDLTLNPNYAQFRALNPRSVQAKASNAVEGIQTDKQSTLQDLNGTIYSKAIALLRQIQDKQIQQASKRDKATHSQIVHVVRALDLENDENNGRDGRGLGEELKEVFREVVVRPILKRLQQTQQTATSATSAMSHEGMDIQLGEIHGLGVHFTHEVRPCHKVKYWWMM